MKAEVATLEPRAVEMAHAAPQSETQALIAVMREAILNPAIDLDRMERLLKLSVETSERLDATHARKAYARAMAQFKRSPPQIVKDAHVSYRNKTGGLTEYDHTSLGLLCNAVIEGLAAVGIYHDWPQTTLPDKRIQVTCVLTHELGHKEEFPSIPAFPDDSGGKNAIQANQSTVTYLQRGTLFAATGLAALAPPDRDGRTPPGTDKGPEPLITERQIADLNAKITEVGANKAAFLRYIKVDRLDQIWAKNYKWVLDELSRKEKK